MIQLTASYSRASPHMYARHDHVLTMFPTLQPLHARLVCSSGQMLTTMLAEALKSCERLRGSSLMRSITCKTGSEGWFGRRPSSSCPKAYAWCSCQPRCPMPASLLAGCVTCISSLAMWCTLTSDPPPCSTMPSLLAALGFIW